MNVIRGFVLLGTGFLVIGIVFGMYMGGSGDTRFAPLHAHLNLLGFVLSMIFAFAYHLFPAMLGRMATAHFWLHAIGAAVLLFMLFLLLSGRIGEAAMAPIAPIAELAVLVGVILFLLGAIRHVR